MRTRRLALLFALTLAAFGCDGSGPMNISSPDGGGGPPPAGDGGTPPAGDGGGIVIPFVSVSGQVVDFQSGAPAAGALVSTTGVSPAPTVMMNGNNFTLTQVQPFSVFYLIVSVASQPSIYQAALTVNNTDVNNVLAASVSSAYLSSLAGAFKTSSAADHGTLLVQVVDDKGAPLAGVPASALMPAGAAGATGPFFLDAQKQPDAALTATSASGYAVYFNVPAGSVTFSSAGGYTATGAAAPIGAGMVTLASLQLTQGTTTTPKNVSFATQIVPIFMRRGCTNCHSGNGPGRDLGGLTLDASVTIDYRELTQEISPNFHTTRVDLQDPAKSLVLTMPSYENPPDAHPTVVFPSSADPDYQLILTWITEGAKMN